MISSARGAQGCGRFLAGVGSGNGGSARGRRRRCRSLGCQREVWLDAEDYGDHASVNDKVRGGLDLPLELAGVRAEDGGGQSSMLPKLRVMRR